MNFRILRFIKFCNLFLGWQNLDRTIAYTRFHRIKGGGGVPSPTNNFDRVDEIQRFLWILLSVTLGARFIKFHQLFQRLLVIGGRGALPFYFVKLCVMINFSLRHNVLCFSFVAVLYSMYSLYAIIKVVLLKLMKEIVMCNTTWGLKVHLQGQQTIRVYWSTVILTLPIFLGRGDSYLKSDF